MSAVAAVLVRSFTVGAYECMLTFPPTTPGAITTMVAEWSPTMPASLTSAELEQYRMGRDDALRELAEIVGRSVAAIG